MTGHMQAGITNAALASVGVQVMNVLMTVVAASLMDRAGRKQLLTISFRHASMCIPDPSPIVCDTSHSTNQPYGCEFAPLMLQDYRQVRQHPRE